MSKSLVLVRPRSRSGSAAALLSLLLQLLFAGLMPAADARASAADLRASAGVHVENRGVHHHAHDAGDCVFCVTMQLGAAPAAPGKAPEGGQPRREAAEREPARRHTPALPAAQVARAPPAA